MCRGVVCAVSNSCACLSAACSREGTSYLRSQKEKASVKLSGEPFIVRQQIVRSISVRTLTYFTAGANPGCCIPCVFHAVFHSLTFGGYGISRALAGPLCDVRADTARFRGDAGEPQPATVALHARAAQLPVL